MKTLSIANPKARKEHVCNYCCGKILIGEAYQSSNHVYDGDLYTWKSHLDCQRLAEELKMFEDYEDGVTEGDFTESINDYFYENLATVAEENVRTTFLERLKMVKENVLTNNQ